ncbi:DUF6894 family protein [Sphingomonas sp.]|uniref:DUF6894 family protein n=1 Tax=Sphingomonas sp. TaxID=28214 RepID=UPI0039C929C0
MRVCALLVADVQRAGAEPISFFGPSLSACRYTVAAPNFAPYKAPRQRPLLPREGTSAWGRGGSGPRQCGGSATTAIRTCGEMMRDAPDGFWGSRPWSVTVKDEGGLALWEISMGG